MRFAFPPTFPLFIRCFPRRESQYASLQARLQELQQQSSFLKKKAILADSSLSELQQVSFMPPLHRTQKFTFAMQQALAKAKDAFADVRLPSLVAVKGDEDVEMDSVSEGDADTEVADASPVST